MTRTPAVYTLKLNAAEAEILLDCLNEADHIYTDELTIDLAEQLSNRLSALMTPRSTTR